MSDVIFLLDSGIPTRSGDAIIAVDRFGQYQVLRPTVNEIIPVSGVNGVTSVGLEDRFDDYQYYN